MNKIFITSLLFFIMIQIQAQQVPHKLTDLERLLHEKGMVIDKSVNRKLLKVAMENNPDRWQKAFNFLVTADFKNAAIGTTDLIGKECFATISEYQSKDAHRAKIESHQKYIDIQMVIAGEEKIGLVLPKYATVVQPYVAERDVAFYTSDQVKNHTANAGRIFIFFKDDYHQPGLKIDQSEYVKKLVIKVLE